MTEPTFGVAEMRDMAEAVKCSDALACALRQGADSLARWGALKAWKQGHRTVRGSADYQAGVTDILELLDLEMARLEKERTA